MSQTYIAAVVILVVNIVPLFGFEITADKAFQITQALFTVAAGAFILYRRIKKGDITITGFAK